MGKVSVKRRSFKIKSKKKRKRKVKKLRDEYSKNKTEVKKSEILDKIKRLAPRYPTKGI